MIEKDNLGRIPKKKINHGLPEGSRMKPSISQNSLGKNSKNVELRKSILNQRNSTTTNSIGRNDSNSSKPPSRRSSTKRKIPLPM